MIVPSGFFCLRTHLLSFDRLVDWSAGLTAASADPVHRDAALAADRGLLQARLRSVVERPEVREALFLASPSLEEAIPVWLADPGSERGRRVEHSLVKYFARLTARPTPFGLFAGIATGRMDRETGLCVSGPDECRRHTRLDNEYLFTLTSSLLQDPLIRGAARFHPNDSLTFSAGQGRYAEARPASGGHTFHLVGVDETDALRDTLARASAPGGALRTVLAEALVDEDTTLAEAEGFIDELIASQLLRSDIAVRVTGPEPAGVLERQLSAIPAARPMAEALRDAIEDTARLDTLPLGRSPGQYREIAAKLGSLPAPVELPRLFQVDMVRPEAGTLGDGVVQELRRAAALLHRITPSESDPVLARFAARFSERYQGRTVPLLEALDDEIGLGASLWPGEDPSPLIRGLPLTQPEPCRHHLGAAMLHRLHQAGLAAVERRMEWRLTREDVEHLQESPVQEFPPELAAVATLAAAGGAAVARGEFELQVHHFEPGAARLLGRFCHADSELARAVSRHLRAEEARDPEALYAEVVHLPEGRLGNVLLRPVLREWEITYLGHSGAAGDRQIPASDLLLEVREGRCLLWSRKLGRRIIPRLASAHNPAAGLSPYRFLSLLQYQDFAPALHWQWGAAAALPFLPRVTHGRLVLALARWRLTRGEAGALGRGSERQRFEAVQEFRARRGLPRWVALVEGDNRLPTDLDNLLAVEALLQEIGHQQGATLEELWPAPESLVARGPDGGYRHELIVPLLAEPQGQSGAASVASPPASAVGPRRFPPGSDWLYVKLYTSEAETDVLLHDVIGPHSRHLHAIGEVESWFFVRYGDPDHHLRWRLQGAAEVLWGRTWPAIERALAPLLAAGRVWRLQLDTYDREVERYGGPGGIERAERIFHADSEAVVELLGMFDRGDAGLEERWRLGVAGVDRLFDDFGLSLEERLQQLGECVRYGSVPAPGTALRHRLSERFRAERAGLESLLDPVHGPAGRYAPGLEVLGRRSSRLREPIAALGSPGGGRDPGGSRRELIGGVAHLHLNRLLRGAARAHETVIYDFLKRVYQSRQQRGGTVVPGALSGSRARERGGGSATSPAR